MALIQKTNLANENGQSAFYAQEHQTYIGRDIKFNNIGHTLNFDNPIYYPPTTNYFPTFLDSTTQPTNARSTVNISAATGSLFGQSVAIGSNRVVIGAPLDTVDGTANRGAAYILSPNYDISSDQSDLLSNTPTGFGNGYTSYIKINRPDSTTNTYFGWYVACGSDRIAVGAPSDSTVASNSGTIYLYRGIERGTLLKTIRLNDLGLGGVYNDTATNRYFGSSIAIGCGRIVAGSYNYTSGGAVYGAVYIFDLNGNLLRRITASDGANGDRFGWSVSVGSGRIVVGAPGDDDNGTNSGSAYIFDLAGNEIAKIKPPIGYAEAEFGRAVAVGSQRIIVGCPEENIGSGGVLYTRSGAAYLYGMNGTYLKRILKNDDYNISDFYESEEVEFGSSVAIGDGQIIIGAPYRDINNTFTADVVNAGALFRTDLNGNAWNPSSNNVASFSNLVVVGDSDNEAYGVSCAIGNGICCVGGSTITNLGIDEAWAASPGVIGKAKIGKSIGLTSWPFSSGLHTPYYGSIQRKMVTRNRDMLDILDER
jgi:hypothetical protein